MKRTTTLIVVVVLLLVPVGHALGAYASFDDDSTDASATRPVVREIRSVDGVVFEVQLYEEQSVVRVEGTNTKGEDVNLSGIAVDVDRFNVFQRTLNFSANETWKHEITFESGLDALEKQHTVTVSTVGDYTTFNFTREIDPTNSADVPSPYISNVEIRNGTIDGHPSSVAQVTVVNPSVQTYPAKLMVHTMGTDGSFYTPSVAPGETQTITVELLDDRGSKIAGEARLYAGNFSKGDGALDQVEFVGRAGGGTDAWNESYEPVVGPWDENSYEYENESLESRTWAEKLSGGRTIGGHPLIYAVGGGLVVFAGALRRLL